jgi:hypothetical protein
MKGSQFCLSTAKHNFFYNINFPLFICIFEKWKIIPFSKQKSIFHVIEHFCSPNRIKIIEKENLFSFQTGWGKTHKNHLKIHPCISFFSRFIFFTLFLYFVASLEKPTKLTQGKLHPMCFNVEKSFPRFDRNFQAQQQF